MMQYAHEHEWNNHKIDSSELMSNSMPMRLDLDNQMREYLEGRDLNYGLAIYNGWYPGYYSGSRIIVPCFRSNGTLWWQGRALPDNHSTLRWDSPSGPRGDAIAIVRPKTVSNWCACVEGPMDALAMAELGYVGIAILGSNPSIAVIGHLAQVMTASDRILIPDSDAVDRWVHIQSCLVGFGINARICLVEAGYKDVASMPLEDRREFFG